MNTVVSSWSVGNTDPATVAAQGERVSLVRRFGAGLWRALEAVGRARAHRELLAFAERCEGRQPELARELRAACHQGPMA